VTTPRDYDERYDRYETRDPQAAQHLQHFDVIRVTLVSQKQSSHH